MGLAKTPSAGPISLAIGKPRTTAGRFRRRLRTRRRRRHSPIVSPTSAEARRPTEGGLTATCREQQRDNPRSPLHEPDRVPPAGERVCPVGNAPEPVSPPRHRVGERRPTAPPFRTFRTHRDRSSSPAMATPQGGRRRGARCPPVAQLPVIRRYLAWRRVTSGPRKHPETHGLRMKRRGLVGAVANPPSPTSCRHASPGTRRFSYGVTFRYR